MATYREKALERVRTERRRLEKNLAPLTPEQLLLPGVIGDWSVKDILAHLAEWEALCLEWVSASRRGETPGVPAPKYTWKQIDALNAVIYAKYRDCSLSEVLAMFQDVHARFEVMLDSMSEEELGAQGYFPWMGNHPFINWVGGFGAHDAWAKLAIRKFFVHK